jgi:hypothetical protein
VIAGCCPPAGRRNGWAPKVKAGCTRARISAAAGAVGRRLFPAAATGGHLDGHVLRRGRRHRRRRCRRAVLLGGRRLGRAAAAARRPATAAAPRAPAALGPAAAQVALLYGGPEERRWRLAAARARGLCATRLADKRPGRRGRGVGVGGEGGARAAGLCGRAELPPRRSDGLPRCAARCADPAARAPPRRAPGASPEVDFGGRDAHTPHAGAVAKDAHVIGVCHAAGRVAALVAAGAGRG